MHRALTASILVFALTLPAAPPVADATQVGMDPAQLARIPARFKQFVDQGATAGAVTLVARRGKVVALDAIGWQDLDAKKPMRTDSIFQIMSMTKPVTATAIMMLVDEGKVALNVPVERYLPEFRGQLMVASRNDDGSRVLRKPSRVITVRDLLMHTSGMIANPPDGVKELYYKLNHTLAEAVGVFSQQPLEFEPGSKWQYSNPGIATLGRIVEVAADQSYERFLEERIFKPLGMKDTFLFPTPDRYERIALVYKNQDGKLTRAGSNVLGGAPHEYRKGAKYSGPEFALYSTASDMAAFYQLIANNGSHNGKRLLSRAAVEAMVSLQTGDLKAGHNPGTGFGLAWEVTRDAAGTMPFLSIGSHGHGGAFGTHGWIDPRKELIGVFMIQNEGGPTAEMKYTFMAMAGAAITD